MIYCFQGTNFEGGTRGVGFISGGYLNQTQTNMTSDQLLHITDWFSTLLSAAGDDLENVEDLDGVDQWDALNTGAESNRNEIVYNLKIIDMSGSIRVGPYKLLFHR